MILILTSYVFLARGRRDQAGQIGRSGTKKFLSRCPFVPGQTPLSRPVPGQNNLPKRTKKQEKDVPKQEKGVPKQKKRRSKTGKGCSKTEEDVPKQEKMF